MLHSLWLSIGIKHWAILPVVMISLVLPFSADAQAFGQIPNTLDADEGIFGPIPNLLNVSQSTPRGGSWSIRPFMRLGNGYRSAGTGAPRIPRTPRTPTTVGIFGPIPLDLTRGQGFGEIPNLLSWRDR